MDILRRCARHWSRPSRRPSPSGGATNYWGHGLTLNSATTWCKSWPTFVEDGRLSLTCYELTTCFLTTILVHMSNVPLCRIADLHPRPRQSAHFQTEA
jgi:hypothetical protein